MFILIIIASMLPVVTAWADKGILNSKDRAIHATINGELGFIGVLNHVIQFGQNGSRFDYVADGGQEILFPSMRISGELEVAERHRFIFLYQPLTLETTATLTRDILVEDVWFLQNEAVNLKYGFAFWRFSYLFDVINKKQVELSVGLSMQIRNADILFETTDGEKFVENRGVGPVPILKLRFNHWFAKHFWWGMEIDGFYAGSKILNGSTDEFEGAILDTSLRLGYTLTDYLSIFANVRHLGGGAVGTEDEPDRIGDDGYTHNWFHTLGFSVGIVIR